MYKLDKVTENWWYIWYLNYFLKKKICGAYTLEEFPWDTSKEYLELVFSTKITPPPKKKKKKKQQQNKQAKTPTETSNMKGLCIITW